MVCGRSQKSDYLSGDWSVVDSNLCVHSLPPTSSYNRQGGRLAPRSLSIFHRRRTSQKILASTVGIRGGRKVSQRGRLLPTLSEEEDVIVDEDKVVTSESVNPLSPSLSSSTTPSDEHTKSPTFAGGGATSAFTSRVTEGAEGDVQAALPHLQLGINKVRVHELHNRTDTGVARDSTNNAEDDSTGAASPSTSERTCTNVESGADPSSSSASSPTGTTATKAFVPVKPEGRRKARPRDSYHRRRKRMAEFLINAKRDQGKTNFKVVDSRPIYECCDLDCTNWRNRLEVRENEKLQREMRAELRTIEMVKHGKANAAVTKGGLGKLLALGSLEPQV